MRNVLIGNGVVIQFGGVDYLNASIITRALEKVRSGSFPSHLYPEECADLVAVLCKEHARVLNGGYDGHAPTSFERTSLSDFKLRYDKHRLYAMTEIGLEDYFLILDLV